MKTKIYLLIVMIVSMSITQSCHLFRKLTAAMGVERSSVESKEDDSWKGSVGVQTGASIPVVEINDLMSIRAGMNLSLQGAKWKETNSEGKATFLYVNLPLVFRFQTKFGFFGEAGFQPGLLLLAKEKGSYYNQAYPSENVMEYYKKLDLGMPIGVGYQFKNNFGVGLRFTPGLLNIYKESDSKARNLVIALRGTYTFNFK
jgi:hypothetical protein